MSSPVLVTGGTGTLGRLVVARLRDTGREVRVLSRTPRELGPGVDVVEGDLMTGAGVERAVAEVETVVHCAGTAKEDDVKARTLVRAGAGSGTSCSSRWSPRTGCRSSAASTGPCSATSRPSAPPSGSSRTAASRSRRYGPPSSTSCCSSPSAPLLARR